MKTLRSIYLLTMALLLVVVMLGVGCATLGIGGRTPTWEDVQNMTHKDRAILAITTWNDQWDSYEKVYADYKAVYPEGLPEMAKEDLQSRKDILVKLKPIIKRYDEFAQAGGVISQEDIREISAFLRIYYLKKKGE